MQYSHEYIFIFSVMTGATEIGAIDHVPGATFLIGITENGNNYSLGNLVQYTLSAAHNGGHTDHSQ